MGKKENEKQLTTLEHNPQRDYLIFAVKLQLEFGEVGDNIVNMVNGYITTGLMDWEDATIMLNGIFNPDEKL